MFVIITKTIRGQDALSMCDFLASLEKILFVICTSFHEIYGFHHIYSLATKYHILLFK
jgi:hypothetical protein